MKKASSVGRPSVAVIVPVLNEAASIGSVVAGLVGAPVDEVVVVDGGSRDATAAIAQRAGARVVLERRRGYGRACATGVAATRADVVAFLDGDGSDDPAEIERVLKPLLRGEADLVLGARTLVETGALPVYAWLGNAVAAALISARWGQRITDLPSCKAIRRSDLIRLGMTEASYGWTVELIVKAARCRLRLREVPLRYRRRLGGESKVSGNPVASGKAALAILRVVFRHALGQGDVGRSGRLSLVE